MNDRNSDTAYSRVGTLPVGLLVRICNRSLTLQQLLDWAPGTILSFEQSISAPLTVSIGDREIGAGHAVTTDSKFGVRLSRIGDDTSVKRASPENA